MDILNNPQAKKKILQVLGISDEQPKAMFLRRLRSPSIAAQASQQLGHHMRE